MVWRRTWTWMVLLVMVLHVEDASCAVNVRVSLVWVVPSSVAPDAGYLSHAGAGVMMALNDANRNIGICNFTHASFDLIPHTVSNFTPPISSRELLAAQFAAVADNSVGVIGPYREDDCLHANDACGPDLLPQVTLSSVNLPILGSRRNFFSANTPLSVRNEALVDMLQALNYNTVGYVSPSNPSGIVYESEFLRVALEQNVRVPFRISYDRIYPTLFRDSMQQAIHANLRVFAMYVLPDDFDFIVPILDELNMFDGSFVIALSNIGFVALTSLESQTKLAQAHVFGPLLPALDPSDEKVQSVLARVPSTLPPNSDVYPQFNPATDGAGLLFSNGYDMAMSMFVAIEKVLSEGGDPYDRKTLLDKLESLEFEGLRGTIRVADQGATAGITLFQLVPPCGVSSAICTVSFRGFWTRSRGFDLTYPGQYIDFLGNRTIPNFTPDTCNSLNYRSENGTCVSCPAFTYNDPNDGVEVCKMCPLGFELVAGACQPCSEGWNGEIGVDGVPRCVVAPDSVPWALLFGTILGGIGLSLLIHVALRVRQHINNMDREKRRALQRIADEKKFLAFVFHELRNPLNGVASYLSFAMDKLLSASGGKTQALEETSSSDSDANSTICQKDGDSHSTICRNGRDPRSSGEQSVASPGWEDDLRKCSDCVTQLEDIIDTVLELREAVGSWRLRLFPVNLVALANEIQTVVNAPDRKGVCVSVEVSKDGRRLAAGEDLWIRADRLRVRSVLVNLIEHSKQNTTDGQIRVQIETVECDYHTIAVPVVSPAQAHHRPRLASRSFSAEFPVEGAPKLLRESVICRVRVQDSGTVLSPSRIAHLFDPYHEGIERQRGGLGLVLASFFVQCMGGTIRVDSPAVCHSGVPPCGTSYEFTFPTSLFDPESPSLSKQRSASSPPNTSLSPTPPTEQKQGRVSPFMRPFSSTRAILTAIAQGPSSNSTARPTDPTSSSKVSPPFTFTPPLNRRSEDTGPSTALPANHATELTVVSSPRDSKTLSVPQSVSGGNRRARPARFGPGLKVLVVDDVAMNRSILARKLKLGPCASLELQISEAASGEECLTIHSDKHFDLIFMDERMGPDKLLGSETARQIRGREREMGCLGKCIIIACTGNAAQEDRDLFMASGMNAVIAKPIPGPADLRNILEDVFSKRVFP